MFKLQQLEEMYVQGKISRRQFLAQASALGLTAAVSPALLRGSARAARPKKGGTLKMGISGAHTSDVLDPALVTAEMEYLVTFGILRNNLVELDHNSEPVPELAESWEPSPDATKWTFKLRKGVEFHNGKTMDAEDVVFSVMHHKKEDSKSVIKSIVKPIKEVKAEDKHTVSFTLESGNADFPYLMNDVHLQIVPKDTTDFEKGIGTGGYKLESWEPGVRMFTKKNPNYFKEDRAHFDALEILGIADVTARTNAVRTKQVDVINRCDKKTVHLLGRLPGVNVVSTTGTKHYTMPMLCDRPPFQDNNTRLAMKHALDREEFVKTILRGHGMVGNDHPIGPSQRFYNPNLPQRSFDPDKARHYIKKAGLQDQVFKLHVADAGFPGSVDAAVLYKENAKKAGINIEVVQEPNDGYWSNVWMKKSWCSVFWGGRPTCDWMFSTVYKGGAPWNDAKWKNDRFDKLLAAARSELDQAKRREMYYEMQSIVRDDGGTVVLGFVDDLMAVDKGLAHDEVASCWELDGWKIAERWWFTDPA